MAQETGSVPQWFADFAVKNADEHGALAEKIQVSENRMIRWTAGLILGGLTVAVSVLSTIIILVN